MILQNEKLNFFFFFLIIYIFICYRRLFRFIFPLHVEIWVLNWLKILHIFRYLFIYLFYLSPAEFWILENRRIRFMTFCLCRSMEVTSISDITGFQKQIYRETKHKVKGGHYRPVREQLFRKGFWEQVSYCPKSCFIQ